MSNIVFIVNDFSKPFFFPIYRWRDKLRDRGFIGHIGNDYESHYVSKADIVVLTSRDVVFIGYSDLISRQQLILLIHNLRMKTKWLIFYDLSDSTGSKYLDLVDKFHLFLKKKLFCDKSLYSNSDKISRLLIWVNEKPELNQLRCSDSGLVKLPLGWNIGITDFRYFWPKRFNIWNYFVWDPIFYRSKKL